jgi:hypothetical protein
MAKMSLRENVFDDVTRDKFSIFFKQLKSMFWIEIIFFRIYINEQLQHFCSNIWDMNPPWPQLAEIKLCHISALNILVTPTYP